MTDFPDYKPSRKFPPRPDYPVFLEMTTSVRMIVEEITREGKNAVVKMSQRGGPFDTGIPSMTMLVPPYEAAGMTIGTICRVEVMRTNVAAGDPMPEPAGEDLLTGARVWVDKVSSLRAALDNSPDARLDASPEELAMSVDRMRKIYRQLFG